MNTSRKITLRIRNTLEKDLLQSHVNHIVVDLGILPGNKKKDSNLNRNDLDNLRRARNEIQKLQTHLANICKGVEAPEEYKTIISNIDGDLSTIPDTDTIQCLKSTIDQIKADPLIKGARLGIQLQSEHLNKLDTYIRNSIRFIGLLAPDMNPDQLTDYQLNELRKARAEIQCLQELLKGIRKGNTDSKQYEMYIQNIISNIDDHINSIPNDAIGDTIQNLKSTIEFIKANPLIEGTGFDIKQQTSYLDMLDPLIRNAIFFIGLLTIPRRLNRWLSLSRNGYYIPFHQVFEDELPDKEDRIKLLNYLAWQPKALWEGGGLVDASRGLIYRYSMSPFWRYLSALELVAILIIVAAVIYFLAPAYLPNSSLNVTIDKLPSWPIDLTKQNKSSISALLLWLVLWGGIVVHILVANAKRQQEEELPSIFPIYDAMKLISAKLGDILQVISLSVIGFAGAIFIFGDKINVPDAFLVGYSLDSFVELLGTSIEQKASAQLSTIKKQLELKEKK